MCRELCQSKRLVDGVRCSNPRCGAHLCFDVDDRGTVRRPYVGDNGRIYCGDCGPLIDRRRRRMAKSVRPRR